MIEGFGRKLRYLRKLRGLTADELSKLSGVSRSYILLICSGWAADAESANACRLPPLLCQALT
jgi:transcriptional regulator with XRE-family HTH domain